MIWVNSTGIADVGTYVFTLQVTDGLVTLTDTVTLTITNQDPVLLKPFSDLTVRQYSNASFNLRDYFYDGDDTVGYITLTASYSLNETVYNIPSSGVISINNYIVLINPQGPSEAGEYIVTLGISDGLASV